MKFQFRIPILIFLCLSPSVLFAQIEVRDGARPMYVDRTDKLDHGDILLGVVHIGTKPAGPNDKVFALGCLTHFDSGNENGDCQVLFPGGGYTIRRLRNNDPRAYPSGSQGGSVGGTVEVTYPRELLPGAGPVKTIYFIWNTHAG